MTHANAVAAPTAAVRSVAPAHAPTEREADRFADTAAGETVLFAGWSFADVGLHDGETVGGIDTTLTGTGHGLDAALSARLGTQLGADLSRVRVHDGAEAADLTRRAGADAITAGRDIAFAPGRYDPGSPDGVRRIAHEAVHAARHGDTLVAHRDGKGAVTPATTLGGLPEADRKSVQATTTTKVTVTGLTEKFSTKGATMTLGLPANTSVELDASVATKLPKRGMDNVVAALTTEADVSPAPLKENATVTLDLDLTPFGGAKGLYRFTYHSPKASGKDAPVKRVLVEQLGAPTAVPGQAVPATPTPGQQAPPDPVADKMKAHRVRQSYSGGELEALRAAIAEVPDSHLSIVDGVRFDRGTVHPTEPDVAGHYDPKTHTITMFDKAFGSTQVVFQQGSRATSYATRAIIHEIGHAVDLDPIRKATLAKDTADAAVAGLSAKYPDPGNPGGFSFAKGGADEKDVKATLKAQKDAEAGLLGAKSRSGTTTAKNKAGDINDVIGTAAGTNKYRAAAAKDGVAVTKYGEKDWQESYAEAYSLYLSAPDTLKTLRPNTYEYLDKNLPK